MQRQVPTFQKFENSGSSTVTVLDKFVGFQPVFQTRACPSVKLLAVASVFETFSGPDMYVAILAVQDMVNIVDIDGDGQRMCFCQDAWQWFL